VLDGNRDMLGRLDELDARPIGDDVLVDVADSRVGDAAFDDDGEISEREAKVVKGIQLQREGGFDLHSAMAYLADRRRLKNHYLTVQRSSKDLEALGIPLGRGHWLAIIA